MKLIYRKYHQVYAFLFLALVLPVIILGSIDGMEFEQGFVLVIQLLALLAHSILTFSTKEF